MWDLELSKIPPMEGDNGKDISMPKNHDPKDQDLIAKTSRKNHFIIEDASNQQDVTPVGGRPHDEELRRFLACQMRTNKAAL